MTDQKPTFAQCLSDKAKEFEKTMQCTCDLDRWEPESSTGHSWVCRIHKNSTAFANEELFQQRVTL